MLTKPLKKCKHCGKEAQTIDDLPLFVKDKTSTYGVINVCKSCLNSINRSKTVRKPRVKILHKKCNICGYENELAGDLSMFDTRRNICRNCMPAYYWLYHHKDKTLDDYLKTKEEPTYIKKCPKCGLEAHSQKELHLFSRVDENICKKCRSIRDKKYKKPKKYTTKYSSTLEQTISSYAFFLKRDKHTPKNISEDDFNYLLKLREQAYYLSKITGVIYEIDHIYPKNNPLFCGLTTPKNMQLLEKKDNMSKGNRLGYIGQLYISDLNKLITPNINRELLYSLLGCSLSYEEYLEYEKLNFKEYLD